MRLAWLVPASSRSTDAVRMVKGQRKPAGAEAIVFEHGGKIPGKVAHGVGNIFLTVRPVLRN